MPPLNDDLRLLHAAVSYALDGAELARPPLLSAATPCAGWNLHALLDHLSDSMGALCGAMTGAALDLDPPAGPGAAASPDPVARLRREAASLLAACAKGSPADRLVAIGDRVLTARLVTVTGSLEITVHGWDIHAACGARRPVPAQLAYLLLPIAPLLVPPDARDGLFGPPVPLTVPACPGDQLIAFLGRQPHLASSPAAPPAAL